MINVLMRIRPCMHSTCISARACGSNVSRAGFIEHSRGLASIRTLPWAPNKLRRWHASHQRRRPRLRRRSSTASALLRGTPSSGRVSAAAYTLRIVRALRIDPHARTYHIVLYIVHRARRYQAR
uniref:Uncharacterized protein n=2 Tax=Trichogramma kaykai TaxID=54128 RepID=A0ABD2X7G5_9HYME